MEPPHAVTERPHVVGVVVDDGNRPADTATGRHVYAFQVVEPVFEESEGSPVSFSPAAGRVYALDLTKIEDGGNPKVGEYYVLRQRSDRWVFARGQSKCNKINVAIYGYGPGFDPAAGDGSRFRVVIKQVAPGTSDDGKILFDHAADDATPSGNITILAITPYDPWGNVPTTVTIPVGKGVVGTISFDPPKSLSFSVRITDAHDSRFAMVAPTYWVYDSFTNTWNESNVFSCGKKVDLQFRWQIGTAAFQLYDQLTCAADPDNGDFGQLVGIGGATITLHTYDGDADATGGFPGNPITTTDSTDGHGYAFPAYPAWLLGATGGMPAPNVFDWNVSGYDPSTGSITVATFLDALPVADHPKAFDRDGDGFAEYFWQGLCLSGDITTVSDVADYVPCKPLTISVTLWSQGINQESPAPRDPGGNLICPTVNLNHLFGTAAGQSFDCNISGSYFTDNPPRAWSRQNLYVSSSKSGVTLAGFGPYCVKGVVGGMIFALSISPEPDEAGGESPCYEVTHGTDTIHGGTFNTATIAGGRGTGFDGGGIGALQGTGCPFPKSGEVYLWTNPTGGYDCSYTYGGVTRTQTLFKIQIGVWSQ